MEINREDFKEVVVNIGRVTKVVKGGRRFRFNALVVVGNKEGLVGFGLGKAKEVPDAVKKAIDDAFKNIVKVNIKGTTIAHDVQQKYNSNLDMQYTQAESIVFTSQGVPFLQEGEEFKRTKEYEDENGNIKYEGNSYNVGDNINNMDYSLKIKNEDTYNWDYYLL